MNRLFIFPLTRGLFLLVLRNWLNSQGQQVRSAVSTNCVWREFVEPVKSS